jgi:hypothetical protein
MTMPDDPTLRDAAHAGPGNELRSHDATTRSDEGQEVPDALGAGDRDDTLDHDEDEDEEEEEEEEEEVEVDGAQDEEGGEDPLANDPIFAAWPAEVREAWLSLELPSLHDVLLMQERLAAEVRRQNQEIRRLAQAAVPREADADAMTRVLAEARRLGGRLAAASAAGLIALAESADRHAHALATTVQTVLSQPAGWDWLGRARPWPMDQRLALESQVEGARLVRDKARQALGDAGMTPIIPRPGEVFDPEVHRCIGTRLGAPGTVVACEREGWRHGAELLRPADVIIGGVAPTQEATS